MNKKPHEIIHETASALKEMLKDLPPGDYIKYDQVLSKVDTSTQLLTAVNVILREYNVEPVEKVTGYDILTLDTILRRRQICER